MSANAQPVARISHRRIHHFSIRRRSGGCAALIHPTGWGSAWRVLGRSLLAFALALAALPVSAVDFSFALFGDTPYNESERKRLPEMIEAMAREGNLFAVHDGDIKNGESFCNDGLYQDRLEMFQASPLPLVYIPGDNEWTDCHRVLDGRYDPEERLRHLRKVFFFNNQTLGRKTFTLERQGELDGRFAEYRENVRWRRDKLLFVGLNVPGSRNNFGEGESPSREFLAREKANRAWLEGGFELARSEHLAIIFIIIQANPDFAAVKVGRPNPGYGAFLRQLQYLTAGFPGKVVFVHGDTHRAHIDQPLRHPLTGQTLNNFVRVETHGSPHMGWTRVLVHNADTVPRLQFVPVNWDVSAPFPAVFGD